MPAGSPLEAKIAATMRALLQDVPLSAPIPESPDLSKLLSHLEFFIPATLAEIHPYWRTGESLDGILPDQLLKTADVSLHLRGQCILISDQTLTPLDVHLAVSPTADEITSLLIRLGHRGPGEGNLTRTPYGKRYRDPPNPIDWVYTAAFNSP